MKRLPAVLLAMLFMALPLLAEGKASDDLPNWMSYVRDDLPFNQMTIPGTHDSSTKWCCPNIVTSFNDPGFFRTQEMLIPEQLEAGIRYLDLRYAVPGIDKDSFDEHPDFEWWYLCHGDQESSLAALVANGVSYKKPIQWGLEANIEDNRVYRLQNALDEVLSFLHEHSNECVLLFIKDEFSGKTATVQHANDGVDQASQIVQYLMIGNGTAKVFDYKDCFYEEGGRTCSKKMKDLRGCIILVDKGNYDGGQIYGARTSSITYTDYDASRADKLEAIQTAYIHARDYHKMSTEDKASGTYPTEECYGNHEIATNLTFRLLTYYDPHHELDGGAGMGNNILASEGLWDNEPVGNLSSITSTVYEIVHKIDDTIKNHKPTDTLRTAAGDPSTRYTIRDQANYITGAAMTRLDFEKKTSYGLVTMDYPFGTVIKSLVETNFMNYDEVN